ncbi:MAG: peptide ABC transporter substrate-binding protein [Candidatus Spyradosoma sp.]
MKPLFANVPAAVFRVAALGFCAFACVFAASACGPRERATDVAAREGVLLVNNGGEPSALDPQLVTGVTELRLMLALFEGLVRYDPKTLEPRPAIAERWEVSPDGLRWTFRLDGNAKFSDGRRITSEDFLFSYRRLLSPKLASPCASLFFAPVKNALAFARGEITDFSRVGFSAPDAETLVVELAAPCPYFLSLACHSSWSVVPAHAILKFGKIDERSTLWTRPENFVGSGPFRLKSWRVAYRIEVEKNPHYRDAENVRLNAIRFDALGDQFAEERAFRDGQYHVTNTVPPARVAVLRERGDPALRLDPYLSVSFIRVNCSRPPLNDVRVRRALSLALDRDALAERVTRAGETPAYSIVPAAAPAEPTPPRRREEELREARRLLAEAGFPDGRNFPEISYLFNTSDGAQFFAQAIQEMWRKNLGVKVALKNQEYKVYRVSMEQGDYDLARSAWSGDYLDATTFLDLFAGTSNMNWTGWSDAGYDRALAAAARERDAAKRSEKLREAEKILVDAVPVIPTVFNRNKFLISPAVKGWWPNLLDVHPYNAVTLDGAE